MSQHDWIRTAHIPIIIGVKVILNHYNSKQFLTSFGIVTRSLPSLLNSINRAIHHFKQS